MKRFIKKFNGIAITTLILICFASCSVVSYTHEHTFSNKWSSDSTYHWHDATCEHSGTEIDGKDKHIWDDGANGEKSCSVCGYKKEFRTLTLNSLFVTSTQTFTLEKGSNYTLPTLTCDGYYFYGWKDSSNNKCEDSVTVSDNITLTAIWLEPSGKYKEVYEEFLDPLANNYYSKNNEAFFNDPGYPLTGIELYNQLLSVEKIASIELVNNKVSIIVEYGYYFDNTNMCALPDRDNMEGRICDFSTGKTHVVANYGFYFDITNGLSYPLSYKFFKMDESTKEYYVEVN